MQQIYFSSENNTKKTGANSEFYKRITELFTEYSQEKGKAVNKFRRKVNGFFACVRSEDSIDWQTVLGRILAEEGITKKLKQEICSDSNVAYFRFSGVDAFINEGPTNQRNLMGPRP